MLELKNSDRELNKETVIESLKTVSGYLEDLATGRTYKENDEIVLSIQKWGIENSQVIYYSLRLRVIPESIGKGGRSNNTALATTNKILRKIGYDPVRSQLRNGKGRAGVYRVKNAHDEHGLTIYEFLKLMYEEGKDAETKRSKISLSNLDGNGKEYSPKSLREKPLFVYIVQCSISNIIKIGISNNPQRRIVEIQTHYPYKLFMLRVVQAENARKIEADLHKSLRKFRLNGEWFNSEAIHQISTENHLH
jgi:Meiotically up-regulated gene 113